MARAARMVLAAGAVLLLVLVPLWWTGELRTAAFAEPLSPLQWDEGQRLPGHSDAPVAAGPGADTPAALAWSLVGLPAILLGGLATIRHLSGGSRGSPSPPAQHAGSDQ